MTAAAASQPSRLRVTIRAGVASSSTTAITYTSSNVRPSPNTLSQNWPEAITSSSSTKPAKASRSCAGAVLARITAKPAATNNAIARNSIRL